MFRKSLYFLFTIFFLSCTGLPEGIRPVENFELQKYLGTWYEIARLDHSFEHGLKQVTARYEILENGMDKENNGVRVINRGFSEEDSSWSQAEGKAYFVEESNKGYLKVSFFGPFYGSYVVFELDQDYQYAFVTSSSRDYLWFLSRNPQVSQELKDSFVKKSKMLGFAVDKLIWVKQEK